MRKELLIKFERVLKYPSKVLFYYLLFIQYKDRWTYRSKKGSNQEQDGDSNKSKLMN